MDVLSYGRLVLWMSCLMDILSYGRLVLWASCLMDVLSCVLQVQNFNTVIRSWNPLQVAYIMNERD